MPSTSPAPSSDMEDMRQQGAAVLDALMAFTGLLAQLEQRIDDFGVRHAEAVEAIAQHRDEAIQVTRQGTAQIVQERDLAISAIAHERNSALRRIGAATAGIRYHPNSADDPAFMTPDRLSIEP